MTTPRVAAFLALSISMLCACCDQEVGQKASASGAALAVHIPPQTLDTEHFSIRYSAEDAQAKEAGRAVEALYDAFEAVFAVKQPKQSFRTVLYATRAEFKQHNRSASWAEAFYRRPYAVAYPGEGSSPYHWMLHEVTHQLLAEAAGYVPPRWLNEGLASYFGSSKLSGTVLYRGDPNEGSYPIWWMKELGFDSSATPLLSGVPLPTLEQIVEQNGPPVAENVNSYYLAWWSLTHYLMQGEGGIHRDAVIALLEQGGSPEAFRRLIGSYADIEPRWHRHLLNLAKSSSASQ